MLRRSSLLKFLGFNTQGDLGPWTFYTSKRKGLVFFQKSPPLEPPTLLQIHQRNKFRLAAYIWRSLTQDQQERWSDAAEKANLRITGYNLFVFWICKQDDTAIRTIERHANIKLIPLEFVP
jgi:hypothetical protein